MKNIYKKQDAGLRQDQPRGWQWDKHAGFHGDQPRTHIGQTRGRASGQHADHLARTIGRTNMCGLTLMLVDC